MPHSSASCSLSVIYHNQISTTQTNNQKASKTYKNNPLLRPGSNTVRAFSLGAPGAKHSVRLAVRTLAVTPAAFRVLRDLVAGEVHGHFDGVLRDRGAVGGEVRKS